MDRVLTSHKVNGLNECLRIEVLDGPGSGGACHEYLITCESGPPQEESPVGNTRINLALLAIVEDRLRSFELGPFACLENWLALERVREAMMWLQKRTRDRMARGVEGTHQK